MSFISALLTGGVLIGKICQAVAGGVGRVQFDADSGVLLTGELHVSGVKFYRRTTAEGTTVMAWNQSTKEYAQLSIPNGDEQGAGVEYTIPPTQAIVVPECDSPLVPPGTEIATGLIGEHAAGVDVDGKPSYFRLAFNNLRVGSSVQLGSFRMRCTTGQLVIVAASTLSIGAMTFLSLRSGSGVSATTQERITPKPPTEGEGVGVDREWSFPINFADLGINPENDVIGGQVTFEMGATTAALQALSAAESRPLDDLEKAFFGVTD